MQQIADIVVYLSIKRFKKTIDMRTIIIGAIILMSGVSAFAQFSLRPQIGVNSSRISTRIDNPSFQDQLGFQFGLDMQIGRKMYIQPGIYWESANNELRDMIEGNNTEFTVNRIRVPIMVGYKVFSHESRGLLDLRFFTGPNISYVIDKDLKQTSLIGKNEFRDALYGWNFGAGLDVAIFFVDVGYVLGLSDVFDRFAPDSRNNMYYLNVGLRIGF